MKDTWIPLLNSLALSKTEKEVVRRFESDPQGRTFLPVADILRSHRLVDESLELLMQGVQRHSGFTVARVVLARELLQKGMVMDAWRILEESPVSLRDNLLAQKLRFKLGILIGDSEVVKATFHHLKLHQMLDAEGKRLWDLMEASGLEVCRERLIKELQEKGSTVVLPAPKVSQAGGDFAVANQESDTAPGLTDRTSARRSAAESSLYFDASDIENSEGIQSFLVVPLNEIFRPDESAAGASSKRPGSDGIELDSTTLADIYEHQGHYGKALEVYRRLLRMTPQNDSLRRKVQELTRLDREQRDVDLAVDPSLVDRMESVEIIDRQIKFYNGLLSRLT